MKRHRTQAKIRLVARDERAVAEQPGGPPSPLASASARPAPRPRRPSLTLADASLRTHTLIPTGRLDRRSAPILEAEMERLHESGVSSLVLDLRQLAYVDSTGLAVLAFRCELCKRQGYDLRLIPGSRLMRRAFEAAGITDFVSSPQDDDFGAGLPAATSERS
jgi:anti-anti-sigma factor